MKAFAATHIGLGRPINQDAYYLPVGAERFMALADGMGGHQAGEVASALAVARFAATLREAVQPNEETLERAIASANAAIYDMAQLDAAKRGMGTTLTALWFDREQVFLAHVGDSRAYLLRNRALMQLSRDHSLVSQMVERGEITPREALTHPQRNVITRAIGTDKRVRPDVIRLDFKETDVWFLCSDGLSNYVRNPEIAEVLLREGDWDQKLMSLIDLALGRGGSDNITVMAACGEAAGK